MTSADIHRVRSIGRGCRRRLVDDSIVVNLQGDEPLMPVVNIQRVAWSWRNTRMPVSRPSASG